MELKTALETRRSIRKYIDKPVEEEKIREIILASQNAPSWKNSQTARFYVVSGEKLAEVREALPEFNRRNSENAPVLIITALAVDCAGFEKDGTPTNELGNGWGYYDLGLNNMALLLKATELGLSTLVMGIRDSKMIAEVLGIPETQSVVSVISVGYSDFKPEKPVRKELDEIATFFVD